MDVLFKTVEGVGGIRDRFKLKAKTARAFRPGRDFPRRTKRLAGTTAGRS